MSCKSPSTSSSSIRYRSIVTQFSQQHPVVLLLQRGQLTSALSIAGRSAMVLLAPFIGSVLIILVAFECGLLLGRWRGRQPDPEPQLPARMIISSVLSLLAFMLGFTFGLAVSHFDSRDQALNEEAIAIRTAYHRAA